jgi:uncharacterized protein (TIGR00369 family)
MAEHSFHDEPVRGRFMTADLLDRSGLELMHGYRDGTIPAPPLTRLAGLRPTEVGPGIATFSMPASPWWQTGAGVFPAGVFPFVADGALGSSVLTVLPPGVGVTTSHLSMDFLRTATVRSGAINARSRVVHLATTVALSDVVVEDSTGRMLAHGTSRCFLTRPDASMAPQQGPSAEEDGTPDPFLRPVEGNVMPQDYWNQHSGAEINQQWLQGEMRPPVMRLVGLTPQTSQEGVVTGRLRNSPWTRNGMGVSYGGALAAAADLAMSGAVLGTLPAATSFAPLDIKVNFLRPALPSDGDLTVRATVTHRGRSIAMVVCELVNEAGKRIALAAESVLVLPGRPWDRAIAVSEEQIGLG